MANLSSKVTPSGVATAAQGGLADSAVQPNDSPTFGNVTATAFAGDGSSLTGVLRKGPDIGDVADLNTYTTDGYYHQNSNTWAINGTNYPATRAGMLTVTADGSMVYQKYQNYDGSGVYQRTKYNTTWYDWDKVLDSGNLTTTGTLTATAFAGDGSALTGVGSPPPTLQVFTASGTWTRPAGCKTIKITITGGGQGGADFAGLPGGSAGTGIAYRDVTALSSATLTVGAGSNGIGTAQSVAAGGASTWVGGGTITAAGGNYGNSPVTGADIAAPGGPGVALSGNGGDSFWGGGGGYGGSSGGPAKCFGAGGGSDDGNGTGGDGYDGVIVVEEFY